MFVDLSGDDPQCRKLTLHVGSCLHHLLHDCFNATVFITSTRLVRVGHALVQKTPEITHRMQRTVREMRRSSSERGAVEGPVEKSNISMMG